MAEANGSDTLSIWWLRIDPLDLAMWSPSLVALKSCLGEVSGVQDAWWGWAQERMGPEDLKNKSKGNPFEAVFSKGEKEKWNGSWRGTWDLAWRYAKLFKCRWE